ncbi:helix-turn-helix domain-containing protein [Burkholderia vietnamiensis]|nr:helix-turn-helix transcriptional regulator [Burkholderia vietnamiensis]
MLKLTQTELARRLGVDDAYISAIVDFHRILTHRFHLNLTHPETA